MAALGGCLFAQSVTSKIVLGEFAPPDVSILRESAAANISIPPRNTATDAAGNVYIADSFDNRVRMVSPTGIVTTIAGTGFEGRAGDGGPAIDAQLNHPMGVAIDASGNLYIADSGNYRIRKVDMATGIIATVRDPHRYQDERHGFPVALTVDEEGNIYVTDVGSPSVRKVPAEVARQPIMRGESPLETPVRSFAATVGFKINVTYGAGVPAAAQTAFNNLIAIYEGVFTSNVTVNIMVNFGNTGLGQSNTSEQRFTYPTWRAAMSANAANNPGNTFVAAAVASLPANDPIGNSFVHLTTANARALGLSANVSLDSTLTFSNSVSFEYNGVATSGAVDFLDVAAHELDEALGINSALTGLADNASFTPGDFFAEDFFRYHALGSRLLSTNPSDFVYFSFDGGATDVAQFNQANVASGITGLDRNDWIYGNFGCPAATVHVQNAIACFGQAVPVGVGPEITVLNTLGYSSSQPQTITFNPLSNVTLGAAPFAINATASSGLTVSFVSNSTAVCTVSGNIVTIIATGPCSITASQGGNGTFSAATPVTQSFTVSNPAAPAAPVPSSPTNGTSNVSVAASLIWNAASGATSYDVYLGTSANPAFVTNTSATSYSPGTLLFATTYFWKIVARNAGPATTSSSMFSFTTASPVCAPSLDPTSALWPPAGGISTIGVTDGAGCNWTAVSNAPWIQVTSGASGSVNGTVGYSVAVNSTNSQRSGTMTIAGLIFLVIQAAANANSTLHFVPVTPCRIADTRNATGPFGGPSIGTNTSRDFVIPASSCGIPSNAAAYSLNVTVVTLGPLGFLQVYPAGQPQPGVSTLNSSDGRTKANAAIVPAGVNGAVTVFASNPTHVIIDINGYFVADPGGQALAFYPLPPCRIADTRNAAGAFGGPSLVSNVSRDFPIRLGSCGVPSNAQAYALNLTVVPSGPLGFLSVWPSGTAQPLVSTLNDPTGTVVANAAIVPAGGTATNGGIRVIVTDATNLIIDINGYFAPPGGAGALSFFPVNLCRIMDTRNANGTFGGPILAAGTPRNIPIPSSSCGVPSTAKAYSLNATVVPPAGLGFLQLWNTGGAQPGVSTLNDSDASIVANAAIVPAGTAGSITTFASNAAHLILDVNGYFAP